MQSVWFYIEICGVLPSILSISITKAGTLVYPYCCLFSFFLKLPGESRPTILCYVLSLNIYVSAFRTTTPGDPEFCHS